jgi:hypothetical protein
LAKGSAYPRRTRRSGATLLKPFATPLRCRPPDTAGLAGFDCNSVGKTPRQSRAPCGSELLRFRRQPDVYADPHLRVTAALRKGGRTATLHLAVVPKRRPDAGARGFLVGQDVEQRAKRPRVERHQDETLFHHHGLGVVPVLVDANVEGRDCSKGEPGHEDMVDWLDKHAGAPRAAAPRMN